MARIMTTRDAVEEVRFLDPAIEATVGLDGVRAALRAVAGRYEGVTPGGMRDVVTECYRQAGLTERDARRVMRWLEYA